MSYVGRFPGGTSPLRSTGKGDASVLARRGADVASSFHTALVLTTWLSPPSALLAMQSSPTISELSVWKGCAAHVVYILVAGSVGSAPRSLT